MKYLNLLIIISCFCGNSKGQQLLSSNFRPQQLGSKFIQLSNRTECPDILRFPFSHIRVSDVRFDTSKIGFIPSKAIITINERLYKKLAFRKGAASTIETYYNKYYEKAFSKDEFGLHIFIKKFWLSSTNESKGQANAVSVDFGANARLHIKWELYLFKNDEYLAFRRIDTTLEFTKSARELLISTDETDDQSTSLFNSIFNNLIEQFVYTKAVDAFENKTKKNLAELNSMYAQKFALPVLTAPSINDGVFMNFNEFKNNQPSVKDFQEKQVRFRSFVKSKKILNAVDSTIRSYWAYHRKGETMSNWISTSKMYRCQNTFEYFVKVQVAKERVQGAIMIDNYYTAWVPYQVDMETGESY